MLKHLNKLTYNTNVYRPNERTQVKFCFTVKYAKYALSLVNTLNNSKFESYENFVVFAVDKESKEILSQYNIPFRDSFGEDVYNDKILNAMTLSIENPDTLIIMSDVIVSFDFHDLRGRLGRLQYKDNTIYYNWYKDVHFGNYRKDYKNIVANILLYYNIKPSMIATYLQCKSRTVRKINYDLIDIPRYDAETKITEENVLTQHKHKLNLKHNSKKILDRLDQGFCFCGGGKTINYMIENNEQYYQLYYYDIDILNELRKRCT